MIILHQFPSLHDFLLAMFPILSATCKPRFYTTPKSLSTLSSAPSVTHSPRINPLLSAGLRYSRVRETVVWWGLLCGGAGGSHEIRGLRWGR